MTTIQYAKHTTKKTTHHEKTFKNDAAMEKWLEQQAEKGIEIEVLRFER